MIRRYAAALRLTLVAADTVLAFAVVLVATNIRFGRTSGWPPDVKASLPDANLAVAVFVGMWIAVLWMHGMYRSRARWTRRGDVVAVLRATLVQLAFTLSLLYVLKLPNVSRLLLIYLFPSMAAMALATSSAFTLCGCWRIFSLKVGRSVSLPSVPTTIQNTTGPNRTCLPAWTSV